MKTPQFLTTLAGFLLCFSIQAQTGAGNRTGSEASGTEKEKSSAQVNARRQPQAMAVAQQGIVNESDPYQGRKAEFLGMLTIPDLPVDFPVYTAGQGVKDYNEKVMTYLRLHPDIVTDRVKNKLLH